MEVRNDFQAPITQEKFEILYQANLIPLHACFMGLTWVLHDYILTAEDEIRYIWPQKAAFGKWMFLWMRYYTIALLVFDVTQIHVFSIPGVPNDDLCVAMDSIIRVTGAISLWSAEIILQLRLYALYNCSRKVAVINGTLFVISILLFFYVLVYNAVGRRAVIADAIHLPLPGCPSIHSGIEWMQWIPATIFEFILCAFALYKSLTRANTMKLKGAGQSLASILMRDNILFFFGIGVLLILNNLMVIGATKIPWFSYSPFHAAIGVFTTRMLISIRKASVPQIPQSFQDLSDADVLQITMHAGETINGEQSQTSTSSEDNMMFVITEGGSLDEYGQAGPSRLPR